MKARLTLVTTAAVAVSLLSLLTPPPAAAHCDTLDGPVVKAAPVALEKEDVTPVLKWVKKEHEEEIHRAFEKAWAVRGKSPEAKELADLYFFETLVRIHRAGEGAPYTGLKPAGSELRPAVSGADQVLEGGSVDALVKLVTDVVTAGIRARFADAWQKSKHSEENVEAGREFVGAYGEFVHYVERLHHDATTAAGHHAEPEVSKQGEMGHAAHQHAEQ
jgi:hypothetical protein